ncbi:hypothetical protein ACLOJK_022132 [Asimina triloba]
MARRKVKLAWIVNDSARKVTYKKRKKGLMKKVGELSILCNVSACVIIDNPWGPQPDVWPSREDARRVVTNFKNLPEMEQCKKMVNQEGFIRQRIMKLRDQLKRLQRENREAEIVILMSECMMGRSLYEVSMDDLNGLAWLIDSKLKLVRHKIETIRGSNLVHQTTRTMEMVQAAMMNEAARQSNDHDRKPSTALEVVATNVEPPHPWLMEMMDPYDQIINGGGEQFGNDHTLLDAFFG